MIRKRALFVILAVAILLLTTGVGLMVGKTAHSITASLTYVGRITAVTTANTPLVESLPDLSAQRALELTPPLSGYLVRYGGRGLLIGLAIVAVGALFIVALRASRHLHLRSHPAA